MKILVYLTILGLLWSGPLSADTWSERQALARIQSELQAMMALINEAQNQSAMNARVRFDYQTLKRDLRVIEQGIGNHLAKPLDPVLPDDIVSIGGDYTERH